MDNISTIAKHHLEWISIAKKFMPNSFAEDIVQDTYLKIIRLKYEDKIIVNGEINKSYMYMTIYSVFIDSTRDRKNLLTNKEQDNLPSEDSEIEDKKAFDKIESLINKEISNWHWYDKMLFNLYKDSNLSMRKLSKETGISLTSIFGTIKKCKKNIKISVGEHYQDYKNQNYELILK